MKAIILNSGMGSRMGEFTKNNHKSMVEIWDGVPLIYHQIKALEKVGIESILITTGHMGNKLKDFIDTEFGNLDITYIHNSSYSNTNYIYSMYLASDESDEDVILLHGDLYFDENILNDIISSNTSCVVVDSTLPLPEKDFKAEIGNERIRKIATYINNGNCVSCQPLYKLNGSDWDVWKESIHEFCADGRIDVYAEEALNNVLNEVVLKPLDVKGRLCMEVDTVYDLQLLRNKLQT